MKIEIIIKQNGNQIKAFECAGFIGVLNEGDGERFLAFGQVNWGGALHAVFDNARNLVPGALELVLLKDALEKGAKGVSADKLPSTCESERIAQ